MSLSCRLLADISIYLQISGQTNSFSFLSLIRSDDHKEPTQGQIFHKTACMNIYLVSIYRQISGKTNFFSFLSYVNVKLSIKQYRNRGHLLCQQAYAFILRFQDKPTLYLFTLIRPDDHREPTQGRIFHKTVCMNIYRVSRHIHLPSDFRANQLFTSFLFYLLFLLKIQENIHKDRLSIKLYQMQRHSSMVSQCGRYCTVHNKR